MQRTDDEFNREVLNRIMNSDKTYNEKVNDVKQFCNKVWKLIDQTNKYYVLSRDFI